MALDNFVIGSWNRKFSWRSVWCNTRKERIVGNVFVLMCDSLFENG